jgi:hypothetical protein
MFLSWTLKLKKIGLTDWPRMIKPRGEKMMIFNVLAAKVDINILLASLICQD